jgi:hypothetical protein
MENDRTKQDLENLKSRLLVKRNRVGAESREGRLLSNLIKQRPWLDDTTGDRSWAKHPTQQMPWMMNVQVEALAKGN